ncbi:MAG TPA: hypothetical protein VIQ22_05460 [Gammaproteobacteria bacterium]
MSKKTVLALTLSATLLGASAAWADHNSPMGAGTASMPNDIHNTRIEDDNETFIELVQNGGGADSVNRYDTTTTTTTGGSSMGGSDTLTTRGSGAGGRR